MTLRLKESPREWRKFALVAAVAGGLVVTLLWRRGVLSVPAWRWALGGIGLLLFLGWLCPRAIRPVYRVAMMASHWVGQRVMGPVLLAVLFLAVVTPLGWLLRMFGKDLLHLRRSPKAESHWLPARPNSPLDRLY
jgi:hypothetical protein